MRRPASILALLLAAAALAAGSAGAAESPFDRLLRTAGDSPARPALAVPAHDVRFAELRDADRRTRERRALRDELRLTSAGLAPSDISATFVPAFSRFSLPVSPGVSTGDAAHGEHSAEPFRLQAPYESARDGFVAPASPSPRRDVEGGAPASQPHR